MENQEVSNSHKFAFDVEYYPSLEAYFLLSNAVERVELKRTPGGAAKLPEGRRVQYNQLTGYTEGTLDASYTRCSEEVGDLTVERFLDTIEERVPRFGRPEGHRRAPELENVADVIEEFEGRGSLPAFQEACEAVAVEILTEGYGAPDSVVALGDDLFLLLDSASLKVMVLPDKSGILAVVAPNKARVFSAMEPGEEHL